MAYDLSFPGKIIFGAGTLAKLPEELPPGATVLLVSGKHAEVNGLNERIRKILSAFKLVRVCGIQAEAPLSAVDKIIASGRENKVSTVIAVGGGSVIDAAKAAAAIIPLSGNCADYFYKRRSIPGKGLFLAALPTTAGTGAEATPNAVLHDPETAIKKSIRHQSMFPDLALVDPELTYNCPGSLTAHSGLDALTQAVESYISLGANTVSKALAAKAVQLILPALPKVCAAPDNYSARDDMAEGSLITALAFSQSSLGAVHGLAHPIGSKLHVAHGLACAILLPIILRWNYESCSGAMDELALSCDCENGEEFINKIELLCRELDIPGNFREFGLSQDIFPFILENCRSGSMLNNPRHLEDAQIIEILESLL